MIVQFIVWLMLLQRVFIPPATTDEFSWSMRTVEDGVMIVYNYPKDYPNVNCCSVFYDSLSDLEVARHCWNIKNQDSEIDHWEKFSYKGMYLVAELLQQIDGGYYRRYAGPLPNIDGGPTVK